MIKEKSANIGAEHSHPYNLTGAAGKKKERAGDEDALTGLSARFFHDTLSLLCFSSCSILLKCLPGGSERPLDARQVARHPIDQSKQRPYAKRINSVNTSPISSRMASN